METGLTLKSLNCYMKYALYRGREDFSNYKKNLSKIKVLEIQKSLFWKKSNKVCPPQFQKQGWEKILHKLALYLFKELVLSK
jgi:hypothetical protein